MNGMHTVNRADDSGPLRVRVMKASYLQCQPQRLRRREVREGCEKGNVELTGCSCVM